MSTQEPRTSPIEPVPVPSRGASQGGPATTEADNPRTARLDELSTSDLVALLVEEDAAVHAAVTRALPAIARAADVLRSALESGGRWLNVGAGTSGRIGVLDAAEIPPTFGAPPERVQGVIAGGSRALERAVEGAEDSRTAAPADLEARAFSPADALMALSASGRTPYVLAAVEHAQQLGAPTLCITCAPDSALAHAVSYPIVVEVGPEAIAGSTRLKGGLAQKMVLHTLSTAVFVQLGHTHGNRMTHQAVTNDKLRERALRTLIELTHCTPEQAHAALTAAGGILPRALEALGHPSRSQLG